MDISINDMRNAMDSRIPPRFSGTADRVTYLLTEFKLAVYVSLIAVGILLFSGTAAIPDIPEGVRLALLGVALATVPSALLGYWLVRVFIPDPRHIIAEVNPYGDGWTLNLYRVPVDLWEEREHARDEPRPVLYPNGRIHAVVTTFRYDEDIQRLEISGCNPEIADPVDIIVANEQLDKTFSSLHDDSQELDRLKATAEIQEREVEREILNAVAGAIETGSSIKPGLADGILFPDIAAEAGAVEDNPSATPQQAGSAARAAQQARIDALLTPGTEAATDGGEIL